MFNLIIGQRDGQIAVDRVLEYTNDHVQQYVAAPGGGVDPSRLRNLPTLMMPELEDSEATQTARVGHIEDLVRSGRSYLFRFVPNRAIPEIDTAQIENFAANLHIDRWEFNRTHWAVKDVDLYRIVHESTLSSSPTPKVFRLPVALPTDRNLVAVMMPFGANFAPVYTAH